jgi:hypothetical protein
MSKYLQIQDIKSWDILYLIVEIINVHYLIIALTTPILKLEVCNRNAGFMRSAQNSKYCMNRTRYLAKLTRQMLHTKFYTGYHKLNLNSPRPWQRAGGEIILLVLDAPPIKCCIFSWVANVRVVQSWFGLRQITTRRCVWVVTYRTVFTSSCDLCFNILHDRKGVKFL